MRGFLKSREGLFRLSTKVTSIGDEGCDLVVQQQDSSSSCVQAVVEYNEKDSSFVLKDLNSVLGVYVNDCCLQNASVKLEPNDIIRFGYDGTRYEFLVECSTKKAALYTMQQTAGRNWSSGLTQQFTSAKPSLWQSPSRDNLADSTSLNNKLTDDLDESAGWVSGPLSSERARQSAADRPLNDGEFNESDIMQRMDCLTREVERLRVFENECLLKDDLIEQLHEEITSLQNFIRQVEVGYCTECHNLIGNRPPRLLQLQKEENPRQVDLTKISDVSSLLNGMSPSEVIALLNRMHEELIRTKNDCSLTMGLVGEMHRNMSNKDTTIALIGKDMDSLRKELMEKNDEIAVLDASLQRMTENLKKAGSEDSADRDQDDGSQSSGEELAAVIIKQEMEMRAKDREIALLQRKQKLSDSRHLELAAKVRNLTEELSKTNTVVAAAKVAEKKLRLEIDSLKRKNQDLERTERIGRVDLEQLLKRLEKLRSHAIQAAFAGASSKTPDKLIGDEELISVLKKCAEDRAELARIKSQATSDNPVTDKKVSDSGKKTKP